MTEIPSEKKSSVFFFFEKKHDIKNIFVAFYSFYVKIDSKYS